MKNQSNKISSSVKLKLKAQVGLTQDFKYTCLFWKYSIFNQLEGLKVLSLFLTPHYKTTLHRTWEEVIKGFRKTISSWKERDLGSIFLRVEAVNMFPLSKLWYVSQVLPLPSSFAKKFNSLLSSFIEQRSRGTAAAGQLHGRGSAAVCSQGLCCECDGDERKAAGTP